MEGFDGMLGSGNGDVQFHLTAFDMVTPAGGSPSPGP